MKMMNKMFLLLATIFVAMGFSGCSDDETLGIEIIPPATTPGEKVDNPSTMNFTLNLSGVQEIAYEVAERDTVKNVKSRSSQDANERGALIFKNATLEGGSGIITAVEGENVIEVKNLEGNKNYTVTFAFKTGENKYEIKDIDFTTPGYNKIVTILNVTTEGFKVHVEMPDTVYWRWGYTQADTYFEMEQYGTDDLSRLEYNGGLYCQGSQTFDIKNGELWYEVEQEDWETGEIYKEPSYHTIYPGYSYIFLVAECDADGVINYTINDDGGGWDDWGPLSKLPNVLNYTEEWTSEYITFEGKYAKAQFDVEAPALQPSQLTIQTVKQNERRAVYNIIPSDNTTQYAVTILPQDSYDMLLSWTGPEALKWVALNYNSGIFTDIQEIEISPLDANTSYKVLIYGSYSDDSMLMSFEEFTVTSTPSDKPVANLTVTPLSEQRIRELGEDPAFMVGFNVKCAEGNCAGVKYIANYAADWDQQLEYGMTNEDLLSYYGVDVFEIDDEEFIKGINSAEGFDMTFTSTENTEMVMGIASYNTDEKMSDIIVSRCTSAKEWGLNPIDSPLFTELAGDWTATYKYEHHYLNENWEAVKDIHEKSFKMTIGSDLYQGPEQMDAETYNSLVNYYMEGGDDEATAKAKVEDNFADFKVKAKYYTEKYRSLNRMIVTGFEPLHAYKSAWDLAIDLNLSAVDNDDLFYDFGPKMFLQITEDGATLNSSLDRYPPVSSWYKDGYYTREYFLLGCNGSDYLGDVAFPIEISDDKNTITIKAMDGGYYPSVGYTQYSWSWGASFSTLGLSEITLTRGWNGAEEPQAKVSRVNKNQKINARRGAHRFVKTKLPHSKKATVLPKKTTIDPSVTGQKVIKDMKNREKMIEKLKK